MLDYDGLDKSYLLPEERGVKSRFGDVVPSMSDKEVPLWRFLDLAKLIALISENKLYLARADVFKDKHEGSVTDPMIRTLKKQFEGKPFNVATLSNFRKKVKETAFISCWCMEAAADSDAMWRLYCGEKHGVAITATYREIEAALPSSSFVMAPVRYLDYRIEGFPQDDLIYPFFHKRQAFAHEKEVRIVWIAYDQLEGSRVADHLTKEQRQEEAKQKELLKLKRGQGITIEWDAKNIIRNIIIHPDAPEWYFKVVINAVEKFIPELGQRVRWSSMRSEPLF